MNFIATIIRYPAVPAKQSAVGREARLRARRQARRDNDQCVSCGGPKPCPCYRDRKRRRA